MFTFLLDSYLVESPIHMFTVFLYTEDIQIFVMNMTLISLSEVI